MNRYLLSALTLALLAGLAQGADKGYAAKGGRPLASGIAVEYVDPSVRVQDDFFRTSGRTTRRWWPRATIWSAT